MTKNAVAAKKGDNLPAELMDDIFDHAGEGTQFSSDEMLIPFVRLAQSLTPHLNRKKPEYIPGLELGMPYNNVTAQFWASGELVVVPCFQTTKYLEFKLRSEGGGFLGEIDADDPILQRTTRDGSHEMLPTGSEVVKTDQHFVLIVDPETGDWEPAVIDMKSTALKVSRRWKTQISMKKIKNPKTGMRVTPPLFATMWSLKAVEETNDKGDFYNWAVTPYDNGHEGVVTDGALFKEAKQFRESVAKGEARAVDEDHGSEAPQDNQGGGHGQGDIPF